MIIVSESSKTAILVLCFLSKNIGYQQVHLAFLFSKTAFQFYTTAFERCPNYPNNDMFSA